MFNGSPSPKHLFREHPPAHVLVITVAAMVLIVLSNLSAYHGREPANADRHRLATVFLAGPCCAFIATNVLGREINRTALTVISKPVNRPVFVVGKFLG